MKKTKRNSFITFIFSLLPGAAEMYMGFMKMGASLLAIFLLGFLFMFVLQVEDVFVLAEVLVWIVGFFHARNMAKLTQEELELVEDKAIWEDILGIEGIKVSNSKLAKWIGGLLIAAGAFTLWNRLDWYVARAAEVFIGDWAENFVYGIPRIVIAIALIVIGIVLIKGKKARVDGCSNDAEKNA
ncbi:MAG: hypothetical protein IK050_04825 [Lachnospiraceae bacterium]|nr:hypothetical protein [Lachnospiraceae bacterium]